MPWSASLRRWLSVAAAAAGLVAAAVVFPVAGRAVAPRFPGAGVLPFGEAGFYGSPTDASLSSPVDGIAATPTGKGYWLVAADGGIFSYGDAGFYGSAGSINLNAPIVGMARTPTGKGYWMVAI